jgi:predicted PurR-regulated permease PerM
VGWREDGEVFGILGMLFSVPVCAVLYSLYLEFMKNRTRHDTPLK